MIITLLGVPITLMEGREIVPLLERFVSEDRPHHIVTINPEYFVTAQRNDAFRSVLQNADRAFADGTGIIFAARFRGHRATLKQRCTGVALTRMLLRLAEERRLATLIILKRNSLTTPVVLAEVIHRFYPRLLCTVVREPVPENELQRLRPVVLLAGIGSPDQDLWIDSIKAKIPGLRIAVGVGGTFDFLSGTMKRAPGFVQALGLEWAWRLAIEPKRIGRIVRAVVIFTLIIIRSNL